MSIICPLCLKTCTVAVVCPDIPEQVEEKGGLILKRRRRRKRQATGSTSALGGSSQVDFMDMFSGKSFERPLRQCDNSCPDGQKCCFYPTQREKCVEPIYARGGLPPVKDISSREMV